MHHGDCGVTFCIFLHQKQSQRFAYDHAATKNHHVRAVDIDAACNEQTLDPKGCAWDKTCGILQHKFYDVFRMKSIHVFSWIKRPSIKFGIVRQAILPASVRRASEHCYSRVPVGRTMQLLQRSQRLQSSLNAFQSAPSWRSEGSSVQLQIPPMYSSPWRDAPGRQSHALLQTH